MNAPYPTSCELLRIDHGWGKKGLGIIFHSGSYDCLHHGFSVALAALALGRPVRFFCSYWALEYLKRGAEGHFRLDGEASEHRPILQKGVEKGIWSPSPK